MHKDLCPKFWFTKSRMEGVINFKVCKVCSVDLLIFFFFFMGDFAAFFDGVEGDLGRGDDVSVCFVIL